MWRRVWGQRGGARESGARENGDGPAAQPGPRDAGEAALRRSGQGRAARVGGVGGGKCRESGTSGAGEDEAGAIRKASRRRAHAQDLCCTAPISAPGAPSPSSPSSPPSPPSSRSPPSSPLCAHGTCRTLHTSRLATPPRAARSAPSAKPPPTPIAVTYGLARVVETQEQELSVCRQSPPPSARTLVHEACRQLSPHRNPPSWARMSQNQFWRQLILFSALRRRHCSSAG